MHLPTHSSRASTAHPDILASTPLLSQVEHFLSLVFQAPGLFTRTSTSTSADAASWVQEGALESVLLSSQSDSDSQSAVSREALQGGSLLLGRAELEEYVKLFGKGGNGMEGPLSWYRTRQVNWEDERGASLGHLVPSTRIDTELTPPPPLFDAGTTTKSLPSTLPALLLMATHDAALPPSMARSTPQYVPSVKIVRLQGAGHWVQLELPGVVSLNLERWIEEEVLSKGDAGKGKGKGKGMGMGAWVRAKI